MQIKSLVKEDMKIDETLKLTASHDLEVQEMLEKFEQSVLHASVPLHQATALKKFPIILLSRFPFKCKIIFVIPVVIDWNIGN